MSANGNATWFTNTEKVYLDKEPFTEDVPTGDQKWYRDGHKQSDIKRIYVGKGGGLKTFLCNSYRLDDRNFVCPFKDLL